MGKKRGGQSIIPPSLKVEIKDEIPDNEVLTARDRLNGALEELMHHSNTDSSGDSSDESRQQNRRYDYTSRRMSYQPRKIRRRRTLQTDNPYEHTYVMKLFDRSVDLAQFEEDTPLYPICRAWMVNQPRNPTLVPKHRSPSPEAGVEIDYEAMFDANGELREVTKLPPPLPSELAFPKNRIPSPIKPGKEGELDDIDSILTNENPKTREELIKNHKVHWTNVRKKWHLQTFKNEQRFAKSIQILNTIFKA